jgi:hypothetical protein
MLGFSFRPRSAGQRKETALNTCEVAAGATKVRIGRLDTRAKLRDETLRLYRQVRRQAGRNPSPAHAALLNDLLRTAARFTEAA